MNDVMNRYCVLRPGLVFDDPGEAPTQRLRTGRGSRPPSSEPPGIIRHQHIGEYRLEIQRDGEVVTIALPGAFRLRGRPDQIRGLAAALVAALDG